MREGWAYMMSDRDRGTIYIGVTAHMVGGRFSTAREPARNFCRRYDLTRLVSAERAERIADAIMREKAIKKWRRAWKIALIEKANPEWLDLFAVVNGGAEEAGSSISRG